MESDDEPQLSAETLSALEEFYKERQQRETDEAKAFDLHSELAIAVQEDWQLSQFWYNQTTIDALAKVASRAAGADGKIALLSSPSLYKKIKLQGAREVTLFEFDRRFAAYGSDFMFYDYNDARFPKSMEGSYDLVMADPPFLSEECLIKTADSIKYLGKDKIVLCTGAVMEDLIEKLLKLKKCKFRPEHQNKLQNDFACYSNFDVDSLISSNK